MNNRIDLGLSDLNELKINYSTNDRWQMDCNINLNKYLLTLKKLLFIILKFTYTKLLFAFSFFNSFFNSSYSPTFTFIKLIVSLVFFDYFYTFAVIE